jgi:hypothetical protein
MADEVDVAGLEADRTLERAMVNQRRQAAELEAALAKLQGQCLNPACGDDLLDKRARFCCLECRDEYTVIEKQRMFRR